jgi:hypothetical protein
MEYQKPKSLVISDSISCIQGSEKASIFFFEIILPPPRPRGFTIGAYEADE